MIRSLFSGDKPVVLVILLAVVVAVTLLQILIMPPAAEGTPFISSREAGARQVHVPVARKRPHETRKLPGQTAPARVTGTTSAAEAPVAVPSGTIRRPGRPEGLDPRTAPGPEATPAADSRILRAEVPAVTDINPSGAGVVPVLREEPIPEPAPAVYQVPARQSAPLVPGGGAAAGGPAVEPIPPGPAATAGLPDTEQPPLQTDVTPDLDAGGAQLVVLGPSAASPGDTVTYLISTENVSNISHAPLQIVYDPEVLEFVEAREGSLMAAGGASTFFMASTSTAPGLIHVALSRMPPAGGIDGSGVLCSLTFRAKKAGESPIITAGSRLLDQSAHPVDLRRNDSYVAVR